MTDEAYGIVPKYNPDTGALNCGFCKRRLKVTNKQKRWNYCPNCGKAISWSEYKPEDDEETFQTMTFIIKPGNVLGY